jgi:hypothetical protein
MKNTIKVFGIIAIVAVIGFSLAGCEEQDTTDDPSTEGRLTITGIYDYNGYTCYVDPHGEIYPWKVGVAVGKRYTVSDGEVTIELWRNTGWASKNFTGNDKNVTFTVSFAPPEASVTVSGTVTVDFTNGKGSGIFAPN